jgi:hypothetical protein
VTQLDWVLIPVHYTTSARPMDLRVVQMLGMLEMKFHKMMVVGASVLTLLLVVLKR